jgi:hypothetical protein
MRGVLKLADTKYFAKARMKSLDFLTIMRSDFPQLASSNEGDTVSLANCTQSMSNNNGGARPTIH